MANTNAPFGLRPVGHLNGSTWNGQTNLYYVPASNGSAIYLGDLVKSLADGDANGVPGVQKAAAGDVPRGVVVGIRAVYPGVSLVGSALNLEQPGYISATNVDAVYVDVADAPDLVSEVQTGATATNLVATKLNLNADITVAAPSPATNPLSATVIDNSTITTTSTRILKLRGLVREPNNALGAYEKVLVSFNRHELSGAGTTAI